MIPPHIDFRRLRHVPIGHLLATRGTPVLRRGPRLVGPCPVHGGDNPRAFVVHIERNTWHCFSRCQAGGDVIDLVCRLDRCGYAEAAHTLAALAGAVPLPNVPPASWRPSAPFEPYTRTLRLDPGHELIRRKGIHPGTARRFEVGSYDGRGFLEDCIGVRLHDPRGRPLGYAGRRLVADEARRYGKWKLPPRFPKSRLLYNYHRVRGHITTTTLVLVECPWGVLRLSQLSLPAVALMGVHLSEAQADLLREAHRVVLLLDGDRAGRQAASRITRRLPGPYAIAHLPDDLDPDDLDDRQLVRLLRPLFLS